MNIDDSNRRYFIIIAGILLIVVSIFIASSLVIGVIVRTDNNFKITNSVSVRNFGYNSEINSGFDDVSLAEDHGSVYKDTEKGTIDFEWLYCNDLPLCIDQGVLDSWGDVIDLAIKGKYEPINGTIDVWQGIGSKKEYIGEFIIEFDDEPYGWEPCYYYYWHGHLLMPEGVDYIELASNQWPDGAVAEILGPDGCNPDHIPGKKVKFEFEILYQGCSDKEQQFRIIMIHKSLISGIPNSR